MRDTHVAGDGAPGTPYECPRRGAAGAHIHTPNAGVLSSGVGMGAQGAETKTRESADGRFDRRQGTRPKEGSGDVENQLIPTTSLKLANLK